MSAIITEIEREQLKSDVPQFRAGDTVRVHAKVTEGNKERIQVFEGIVIARQGSLYRASFTVRKISHQVGVERSGAIAMGCGRPVLLVPDSHKPAIGSTIVIAWKNKAEAASPSTLAPQQPPVAVTGIPLLRRAAAYSRRRALIVGIGNQHYAAAGIVGGGG